MQHLADHIRHHELRDHNTLHVVGVVSNPVRYQSRYRLAREWLAEMRRTPNVVPYLVETAFGERQHEIAEGDDPAHLLLRTDTEAWIKESMINVGVRTLLPRDWKYVAWVDADITFRDPEWAQETLHQLQHWHILQPWQNCVDLGYEGNVYQTNTSLGFMSATGKRMRTPLRNGVWSKEPYPFGHSGYAWAATRAFWERTGGLIDFAVLGSADHNMAWACLGKCEYTIHGKMHENFFRRVREWQARAVGITNGQVGYAKGRIEHAFHGAKINRKYGERWKILLDHKYDPDTDIIHDAQGLVRLTGNKPLLERAIRVYNRARHEDSIEDE